MAAHGYAPALRRDSPHDKLQTVGSEQSPFKRSFHLCCAGQLCTGLYTGSLVVLSARLSEQLRPMCTGPLRSAQPVNFAHTSVVPEAMRLMGLVLAVLQTGGNPNQAIYGLADGACGYGNISRTSWPFWQVAALGFTNPISASNLPQKWGCGACLEVTCEGPVRHSRLFAIKIVPLDQSRLSKKCCCDMSHLQIGTSSKPRRHVVPPIARIFHSIVVYTGQEYVKGSLRVS